MNETFHCTYPNEEEALRHLSRVAKLQSGDVVRYKDEDGKIIKGVFFKFTDSGKPVIGAFDPDDGQDVFANVPPVHFVFED